MWLVWWFGGLCCGSVLVNSVVLCFCCFIGIMVLESSGLVYLWFIVRYLGCGLCVVCCCLAARFGCGIIAWVGCSLLALGCLGGFGVFSCRFGGFGVYWCWV